MKQNFKNSSSGPNRIMGQLAAEKKKTVMALCLIAVMAVMWVRVLGRKAPQSAKAATTSRQAASAQSDSQLKICFIELPKVAGRNDVLTRDFFASDQWQDFVGTGEGNRLSGGKEVHVVSGDGAEELMKRVAKSIKLEAIGLGENPRVLINDKLLSVGDKLLVEEGGNTCECELIGIEENTVIIRCGEAEIEFKLTNATETTD